MLIPEQESFLKKMSERNDVWTLSELKDFPEYSAQRLKELRQAELVATVNRPYEDDAHPDITFCTYFVITDKGRTLLLEAKQQREKDSKDTAQQHFQNRISLAEVLIPALTFIFGLLAEHFAGIVDLLSKLFK